MKDSLNILSNRIDQLEQKIDSLNKVAEVQRLAYEINSKQDLITQVNEFYDSAWLKLIIVISVLGILVPIIAQYFQSKNLKDLSEFIRNQMNDSFDRRVADLEEFNKNKIEGELKTFSEKLEGLEKKNSMLLIEIDASTQFLQGRASVLSKQYHIAISSFLKAASIFLRTNRPERASVSLTNLKLCLKSINEMRPLEQADKLLKTSVYKMTIEEMIEHFQKHEKNELYKNQLDAIVTEFNRIKNINK